MGCTTYITTIDIHSNIHYLFKVIINYHKPELWSLRWPDTSMENRGFHWGPAWQREHHHSN